MKAKRDHVCPLSDSAIEVLRQIRQISGAGRYLFPHRSGKGFTIPNRLTYAMRDMNLGPRATPHCWRTTFSAWANENGYRPDAIERQLAHVEDNKVRATYNRALLWTRGGPCFKNGPAISKRQKAPRHLENCIMQSGTATQAERPELCHSLFRGCSRKECTCRPTKTRSSKRR
jgi:hypothetical protein